MPPSHPSHHEVTHQSRLSHPSHPSHVFGSRIRVINPSRIRFTHPSHVSEPGRRRQRRAGTGCAATTRVTDPFRVTYPSLSSEPHISESRSSQIRAAHPGAARVRVTRPGHGSGGGEPDPGAQQRRSSESRIRVTCPSHASESQGAAEVSRTRVHNDDGHPSRVSESRIRVTHPSRTRGGGGEPDPGAHQRRSSESRIRVTHPSHTSESQGGRRR